MPHCGVWTWPGHNNNLISCWLVSPLCPFLLWPQHLFHLLSFSALLHLSLNVLTSFVPPLLCPPTSDGGLHFSRGETHPGGCCQDGCISEADCCEAAATTDSSLLGFISVGGWWGAPLFVCAVAGVSQSCRGAPSDKHLTCRRSALRKVLTHSDGQFGDAHDIDSDSFLRVCTFNIPKTVQTPLTAPSLFSKFRLVSRVNFSDKD